MFCVECGAEGETYEGLCLKCLTERRTLVSLPTYVDLARCKRCGNFQFGGTWKGMTTDEALRAGVEAATQVDALVSEPSVTAISVEAEDEKNFRVVMEYSVALGDGRLSWEAGTKVRFKAAVCPRCSRRSGGYYEAIVQVRGDRRDLSEAEVSAAKAILEEALASKPGEFLSREEEVHGGLDLYLSSNGFAKRLASSIQRALGGMVSTSSALHGRKDGRDIYRMTYLIRLPGYSVGDVLRVEGRLVQVASIGASVTLANLSTGERETVSGASLEGASPLDVMKAKAVVVSRDGAEVQIMDPVTYRTVTLPAASALPADVKEVPVVKVDGDLYLDLLELSAGE
jgi:nonsense-mediated mRNA decay protein 3